MSEPKTKRRFSLPRLIDEAVFSVAPTWGSKRISARRQRQGLDLMHQHGLERVERLHSRRMDSLSGGGYDSAATSRDAHSWMTSRLSPDSEFELDLEDMRDRSRSAYKNYPIARGYVESKVCNTVGCGTTIKPRIRESEGMISADQAARWNKSLKDGIDRWLPRCGKDFEPLYQLERLAERHWEREGEVFVLFGDRRDARSPVNLAVEVIHPKRVATPPNKEGDKDVRLGIERDPKTGQVVAFYVRSTQPGDTKDATEHFDRIPRFFSNGLDRMVHLFDKTEDGQTRGIPAMQIVLNRIKNKEEYGEAEMERNHVAACFAGFRSTDGDPNDLADSYKNATDSSGNRYEDIQPGTIDHIGPGESLEFSNPAGPQGTYAPYMEEQNREIAAGLNFPYEMLTKNWKGLSYSAARAIWNDAMTAIRCRQKDYITLFHSALYRLFVNRMILASDDPFVELDISPLMYRSAPWVFERARYVSDGRPYLDPTREIRADGNAVESGIYPMTTVHGRLGQDSEDVYDDWQEDIKLRRDRELPEHMPQMQRDEPIEDDQDDDKKVPIQAGDENPAASSVGATA